MEAVVQVVYVPGTGKFHKRYIVDGRTVDDGRCGADDNWRALDDEAQAAFNPEGCLPSQLCQFCWPRTEE